MSRSSSRRVVVRVVDHYDDKTRTKAAWFSKVFWSRVLRRETQKKRNPHKKARNLFFGLGWFAPIGVVLVLCVWFDWGGSAKEMDRRAARLSEEGAQKLAVCFHINKSPEQEAESQQIVGQSLLSCLQYPVPYLSRLQRIYPSQHSKLRWSMMLGRSLS